MAATKIYSTAVFVVAAAIAIVLGFSPKFGAVIQAIPLPVMGGVRIVVFGLIAVAGAKIWVDNRVDFSQNRNLIVAAITLVLGTGDFTLKFGGFALGGIGTATFGAILLYALLNRGAEPASRAAAARRPPNMRAWHLETAHLRRGTHRHPQGHSGRPPGHRVPGGRRRLHPRPGPGEHAHQATLRPAARRGIVVLAETLGSCGAAYCCAREPAQWGWTSTPTTCAGPRRVG